MKLACNCNSKMKQDKMPKMPMKPVKGDMPKDKGKGKKK